MTGRPHDIAIRLPEDKRHLKRELLKTCKKNHITMTQLITSMIEWFLEEKKEREFVIRIK